MAEHEGGYSPFEADISAVVRRDGDNIVVVRLVDPTDPNLPTGKQVGWYTPTSGIWQTVWLEARPRTYIAGFHLATSIQPASVRFSVDVANFDKVKYQLSLGRDQRSVDHGSVAFEPVLAGRGPKRRPSPRSSSPKSAIRELWSPEDPNLYEVTHRTQGCRRQVDRRGRDLLRSWHDQPGQIRRCPV